MNFAMLNTVFRFLHGWRAPRVLVGLHTAAFVFEDRAFADALQGNLQILEEPGKQVGFFPLRAGRVAAFFAHEAPSTALPADPLQQLHRLYAGFGWRIPHVLEHARHAESLYYNYVGQIHLRRWSFGRVVLAGDACQSTSPLAGHGASLAMHGADLLAHELLRSKSLEQALERYEAAMKPEVERLQARGRQMTPWLVPRTRWRLALRRGLVHLANTPGMSWLLRTWTPAAA